MAPPPQPLAATIEALSYASDLMEAFKAFDSNNDGLITSQELGGLMASLGYNTSPQEVKNMMSRGDAAGQLDLEAFLEMNTMDLDVGNLIEMLSDGFAALGMEGDETLTGEKLHDVLSRMGDIVSLENCNDIIASVDADGDGAINVEELKIIVDALL